MISLVQTPLLSLLPADSLVTDHEESSGIPINAVIPFFERNPFAVRSVIEIIAPSLPTNQIPFALTVIIAIRGAFSEQR